MLINEVIPRFDVYIPDDEKRVCLWCKKHINVLNSLQEYHILPRKFTEVDGYKYTLPKGIVCDKCNAIFGHKSEPAIIEFMKERMSFLISKRTSKNFEFDGLVWNINKGKLSIHMDCLLNFPESNIPHPKYCLGSDYLNNKISKSSLKNRGLIQTSIQKIALETLYCDFAIDKGDEVAYKMLMSTDNNFYNLTSYVRDYLSGKNDRLVPNVKVSPGKFCFQGNINSIDLKTYKSLSGEVGECVFIFLCGIQFLVSFMPKGNNSLKDLEIFNLFKNNYEKLINDAKKHQDCFKTNSLLCR